MTAVSLGLYGCRPLIMRLSELVCNPLTGIYQKGRVCGLMSASMRQNKIPVCIVGTSIMLSYYYVMN